MTVRKILTGIAFTLCAFLSTAAAAGPSLAGATLKLMHVVNDSDGGQASSAVFVEVLPETSVTVNLGRGYVVNVTADRLMIKFTRAEAWREQGLFTGLVIDNIAWSDAPSRRVSAVTLNTKMPGVGQERADISSHSAQIDFRGLSPKVGSIITVNVETSGD
ncbi:MAG: hypothetical protein H3C28_15420 [Sphingomonadales bacterium]|nr:hypothetical protein [Sphingomonadales bacterium]